MITEHHVFKSGHYYSFISIGCSLLFGCERIGRFYSRLVFKYPYYNLNFRLGFIGKSVSCQPIGLVLRLVTSDNHFKKSGLIYVLRCLKRLKSNASRGSQYLSHWIRLMKWSEWIKCNEAIIVNCFQRKWIPKSNVLWLFMSNVVICVRPSKNANQWNVMSIENIMPLYFYLCLTRKI